MTDKIAHFADKALRQHTPYFVATVVAVLRFAKRLFDLKVDISYGETASAYK
jgi:hypothetical protein